MKLQICLLIATFSQAFAFTTPSFGIRTQAQVSTELQAKKNGKRKVALFLFSSDWLTPCMSLHHHHHQHRAEQS
jgi:hypothetical protein